MMVTASPGDEPLGAAGGVQTSRQIGPLLTTLDSKGIVLEDRVDAYLALTERLRGDENQNLAQEISQHTPQLARLFCVDIMNDNSELSQAALQALGFCVYHQDISKAFSEADSNTVVKALCNALLKTDDKNTSTRALWCLSKQNFTAKTIKAELHSILCAVEHALVKTQFQSMTVEHESVNVIIKLLEQVPEDMPSYASRWAKLVYPLLVHSAHKIRERSAYAIQQGLSALKAHRAEIISTLIPDLKAALVPEMVKLFAGRQELHVLRIWGYFVTILGKALHKGGSLINCLLGVVEQGFKHPSAQVKRASFSVWNILIDNFATEPEILYNAKRLKVLMQPLKATSAKTESVAHAKLDTWWHLCQRLGPRLASNFDLVCVPLLEFSLGIQISADTLLCPTTPSANGNNWPNKQLFGTPKTPQHRNSPVSIASPATPCLNLPPGTPGRKNPTFKSVQSRGVEILAQLLGQPDLDGINMCNIETDRLEHPLISSPTVFMKIAPALITVAKDVIVLSCQQHLGDNIKEDLLLHLWLSLVAHVKNMVELASKRDSVGVFTDFMRCVECLIAAWPSINARMIMKLFESVSRHIPLKVLGSPSYHSSCAGAMHGTPALNFIRMMFGPHTKDAMAEERFFIVYDAFIQAGMSTPSTILGFAQSVVKFIADDKMEFGRSEFGWRLWNRLANPLLEHVIQSNEVNQGDSLDHDFSAMYSCLLYPPARLIHNNMTEATLKTLVKTWTDLYQAFIRCAALVTTAESNQCCEELASRILEETKKCTKEMGETPTKNAVCLETALHMCHVMVDGLDYTVLTSNTGADQLTPSKWTKRKVRPLGNLHSITILIAQYMEDINHILSKRDSQLKTFLGAFSRVGKELNMTSAMTYAIGVVSHVFTHVSQPGLISSTLSRIACQLAQFYKRLAQRGTSTHIFSETTQQKLEKLWIDILTSIQTRYGGPYDNDFLATMSPLLEVTILHPRRSIKDHTLVFWNATFATGKGPLGYCDSLKRVLSQLKEKTPIILPGWSESDNVDTPISQLIESEASQSIMGPPASVIPNFGCPSPIKMHGSFLKRSVQAGRLVASSSPDRSRGRSPGRFSSPDKGRLQSPGHSKTPKRNPSPNAAAARRKLPVDEDSMQFVTIAPSPTKKRVLTEHQKEVMRSRPAVIPGLYNDLEQSQDTQAFNDIFSQTQTQMGTESQMGADLQPIKEPDIAEDQNQTVTEKADEILGEPPSAPCVFNLGINKDKTNEPSEQDLNQELSEQELRDLENFEKITAVSQKENSGDTLSEEIGKDKREDEEKDDVKTKTIYEKHDHVEESPVKNTESEGAKSVKDTESEGSKSSDVAEKTEENASCDDGEQQTPSKQCVNLMPSQEEVTPPKASQCPTDHIVTPVIKIKKMSMQDILRYSPSTDADSQFARLHVDSSPKVFPSSQEKGSTRFRRYKSEEIRASPRSKKTQERTSSFDDMVIMETQSEEIRSSSPIKSLAGKQLVTCQADLAELAEHFELDGIEPLDDEGDANQAANSTDKQPAYDHADTGVKNYSENQDPKTIKLDGTNERQNDSQEVEKGQNPSSEESMEFIDSQEELIPEGSEQPMECNTEESASESDSQSDHTTAEESGSEGSSVDKKMTKEATRKLKERPEFILSTLEELSEPNSQGSSTEIDTKSSEIVDPKSDTNVDASTSVIENKDAVLEDTISKGEDDTRIEPESAPTSTALESKKKGRGRPRKPVSPEGSQEADKPKKGCGRSKKVEPARIDDSSADENLDSQSSEDLSGQPCDEKTVKTRGRPRKTQRDDGSSQDESQSSSELSKGKKKGRGRPKKQKDESKDQKKIKADKQDTSDKLEVTDSTRKDKELEEINRKNKEKSTKQTTKKSRKTDQEKKESVSVATKNKKSNSSGSSMQFSSDENPDTAIPKSEISNLDNSCQDMFGSYDVDAQLSKKASPEEDIENSVTVVEVKTYNKKKRRSFTKLSRKRHHSPTVWDEDDDVPLAKITHSYLDVESQSSDEVELSPKKENNLENVTQIVTRSSQKESSVLEGVQKHHKRKPHIFSSLKNKKSPESHMAKKALRRALKKSPHKKSPNILSPVRIKTSTPVTIDESTPVLNQKRSPILNQKRSPIATRLRAGKLTPTSARRLLAGKGRASPKKVAPVKVKSGEEEEEEDGEFNVSGVEESFDDSFDLPLNKYIKQSNSPENKSKDVLQTREEPSKDVTTLNQMIIVDKVKSTTSKEHLLCASNLQEETFSASVQIIKEVEQIDPKVGQSLQSLPSRLKFAAINGRNSPTECNTPPMNTSPVMPHKFSPRSSSSPVGFAMRRGTNQGSPRQRASPVTCEIPGVFSPSASPTNGILKRRDSDTPSPSPTNKWRRVSFAEPVEQEKSAQPVSPQAKTSSPSRSGSTIAAMMPSPLVTSTASRVVSLQSKFITTPSKKANSTSKLKSVTSAERQRQRRLKKQSLKVMNTRMLFSRGARALMASKQGVTEIGGKKVSTQEIFELTALDSVSRGIPSRLSPSSPVPMAASSPTPSTQGTPALLTQGTQNGEVDSSMEVDYESQEAVFPDLVDCEVPVDKVLHQLTSSMWFRGLEQLIRSRNILTVGHLCSLSPRQVQSLPIRSPKVSTLCQVMEKFREEQASSELNAKLNDEDFSKFYRQQTKLNPSLRREPIEKILSNYEATKTTSNKTTDNTSTDSQQIEKAPSHQEDAEAKIPATNKIEGDSEAPVNESQPFSVVASAESTSAESASGSCGFKIVSPKYKPPVSRFDPEKDNKSTRNDTNNQEINSTKSDASCSTSSRPGKRKRDLVDVPVDDQASKEASSSGQSSPKRQRKRLVDDLGTIAKELSGDTLQNMPADKLFQAHRHVNNLMDSIMAALKTKCRSPSLDS